MQRPVPLEKPVADTGTSATPLSLGAFLRDRRARVQPEPGTDAARRRTPGLRREEVAARAGVSVTWYTWLEQGRGGPPSEEALERLASALALDRAARELLFLIAQQRPPPVVPTPTPSVSDTLQRVLDAIRMPAFIRTPSWDIVAWNEAMAAFHDYGALPPRERNAIRRMFAVDETKAFLPDWEEVARSALAILRIDVARLGGAPDDLPLVKELCATNADFCRLWAENGVQNHGFGRKRIAHPVVGPIDLEFSGFPVDGAEGLSMVVFTPATPADAEALDRLIALRPHQGSDAPR